MYLSAWFPFKIPASLLKRRIRGVILNFEDLKFKYEGFFWESYSINRDEFDRYLADKAVRAGADFLTSTKYIDFKRSGGGYVCNLQRKRREITIKCRHIVAADGCPSVFWSLLNTKPEMEDMGYIYGWELKNVKLTDWDFNHYFLGDFAPTGYGYIFPKTDTVNVGIGGVGRKYTKKDFISFISKKEVKKIMSDFTYLKRKGGTIAVFRPTIEDLVLDGIFFAGEAANMSIKPFGDGIPSAMISGYYAGMAAAERKNEITYTERLLDDIGWIVSESNRSVIALKKISEVGPRQRELIFLGYLTGAIKSDEINEMLPKEPREIYNKISSYHNSIVSHLEKLGWDASFRMHWLRKKLKRLFKE
jgi:digeranylgeranylglycerophospholipid reductase